MPGKSGPIIFRTVVAEVVEKEERVEVSGIAEAECTVKLHTCAFHCRPGFNDAFDRSY
jgi:hypothetical protein